MAIFQEAPWEGLPGTLPGVPGTLPEGPSQRHAGFVWFGGLPGVLRPFWPARRDPSREPTDSYGEWGPAGRPFWEGPQSPFRFACPDPRISSEGPSQETRSSIGLLGPGDLFWRTLQNRWFGPCQDCHRAKATVQGTKWPYGPIGPSTGSLGPLIRGPRDPWEGQKDPFWGPFWGPNRAPALKRGPKRVPPNGLPRVPGTLPDHC